MSNASNPPSLAWRSIARTRGIEIRSYADEWVVIFLVGEWRLYRNCDQMRLWNEYTSLDQAMDAAQSIVDEDHYEALKREETR